LCLSLGIASRANRGPSWRVVRWFALDFLPNSFLRNALFKLGLG
jgi:hypothetical protein